jgi:succinate dehydrogenase / fumarate reductase, cytochrome b subunit
VEGNTVATTSNSRPFAARHEFLIRRLHSLTGLIPVGAFMTVHLVANASILEGPGAFQRTVYQIHSLGKLLPLVEWVFIFLPILFHGLFGLIIIRGGLMNTGTYPYVSNVRYMLQRASGMIALLFIVSHVFHMHGWFHADAWVRNIVEPLGGARFRPYSAPSTLGAAMQGVVIPALYGIGVLTCVFHLANGLWTMGITWGVWTSPAAQRRANWVCGIAGTFLAVVGLSALYGSATVDLEQATRVEDAMYSSKVAAHELVPNPHKRAGR